MDVSSAEVVEDALLSLDGLLDTAAVVAPSSPFADHLIGSAPSAQSSFSSADVDNLPDSDQILNAFEPLHVDLIEQNCIVQEPWMQDGFAQTVFVVAKNVPFVLSIANANFDLTPQSSWKLRAELLFDGANEAERLPVALNKPVMNFRVFADEKRQGEAKLEFRLNILSSHHAGALFRLQVSVRPEQQFAPGPALDFPLFVSGPIRIVSKPGQARRGQKRRCSPADVDKRREAVELGKRKVKQASISDDTNFADDADVRARLTQLEEGQRQLLALQAQQTELLQQIASLKTSTQSSGALDSELITIRKVCESQQPGNSLTESPFESLQDEEPAERAAATFRQCVNRGFSTLGRLSFPQQAAAIRMAVGSAAPRAVELLHELTGLLTPLRTEEIIRGTESWIYSNPQTF